MRTHREPGITLHKPSGRARVRLNGQDVYLGVYGSPEASRMPATTPSNR